MEHFHLNCLASYCDLKVAHAGDFRKAFILKSYIRLKYCLS